MTYCLSVKVDEGLVFASDSRTHAGVDYANVYSKMHRFHLNDDRMIVLLAAGSLATTQAVVYQIQRDLDDPGAFYDLNSVSCLFDAANYVGGISVGVQNRHWDAMQRSGFTMEATFILAGKSGDSLMRPT
jgi:putative proteasome-type protease